MSLTPFADQDATGRRVLSAALRLFVEKGYFNTSVADIVRASGVSTGAIYHRFGDKQHLAETLLDSLMRGIENQFATLLTGDSDPLTRIRALIRLMLQQAEADPQMVTFILYARHREFLPEHPPICALRPFELMRDLVTEAQRASLLPDLDPLVLSAQVFGPTLRLIQARIDGVLPRPLPDYEADLLRALDYLMQEGDRNHAAAAMA
ncbi:TetR/AcrR family transcriptional regulator [Sulfurivirga sp.]|uniref:TetR/AcrR family transcriptional regulator n=1 Tax=Sulfurivirga sp. TaxID=2614236 RepID=UPI0025E3F0CA|nr:TetR/AcrR family transcriptional regulator [Sulfurivirga sp.]